MNARGGEPGSARVERVAQPDLPAGLVHTPARWFLRGALAGVLLVAMSNTLSYFVRSHGWRGLLGTPGYPESIGFPFRMWEAGEAYGGVFVDVVPMLGNAAFAGVVVFAIGFAVRSQHRRLTSIAERIQARMAKSPSERRPFQFSLRTLLVATFAIAVAVTWARRWGGDPRALAGIYWLGPAFLVGLAMAPRGLTWENRVSIVTPCTLILVLVAILLGFRLGVPLERVMLGIAVCWIPQCVLAALVLSIGGLWFNAQWDRHPADAGPKTRM